MKKWLTRIVAIVAVLTLSVFCLTACGDSKGVEGTYYFVSVTIGEMTYEVGDTKPGSSDEVFTKDSITVDLNDDGTIVLKVDGVVDEQATWEIDANDSTKLNIKNGETIVNTFDIVEGKITMIDGETTYVFEKSSKNNTTENNSLLGAYKFKSLSAGGHTFVVGQELPGVGVLTEDFMIYELKANGVIVSKCNVDSQIYETTGSYTLDDNNINITLDGDVILATLSGDTLTFEIANEGMTYVLEK